MAITATAPQDHDQLVTSMALLLAAEDLDEAASSIRSYWSDVNESTMSPLLAVTWANQHLGSAVARFEETLRTLSATSVRSPAVFFSDPGPTVAAHDSEDISFASKFGFMAPLAALRAATLLTQEGRDVYDDRVSEAAIQHFWNGSLSPFLLDHIRRNIRVLAAYNYHPYSSCVLTAQIKAWLGQTCDLPRTEAMTIEHMGHLVRINIIALATRETMSDTQHLHNLLEYDHVLRTSLSESLHEWSERRLPADGRELEGDFDDEHDIVQKGMLLCPWHAWNITLDTVQGAAITFSGAILGFNKHAVLLHVYNAARQKGLLPEIPVLDILCDVLARPVFGGRRPVSDFTVAFDRRHDGQREVRSAPNDATDAGSPQENGTIWSPRSLTAGGPHVRSGRPDLENSFLFFRSPDDPSWGCFTEDGDNAVAACMSRVRLLSVSAFQGAMPVALIDYAALLASFERVSQVAQNLLTDSVMIASLGMAGVFNHLYGMLVSIDAGDTQDIDLFRTTLATYLVEEFGAKTPKDYLLTRKH